MALEEVRASGLEGLALTTQLLRRLRVADAESGVWEAADLQWWWRWPRPSDDVPKPFWVDGDGPVAGVLLTDWNHVWTCDPVVVPGAPVPRETVCARAVEEIDSLGLDAVETAVYDDDLELRGLLTARGFAPTEDRSWTTWMDAAARPAPAALPEGFALADRTGTPATPHPMRRRNGEAVEERLRECSLYDPGLDLAVVAPDGAVAGYALFWSDPVTSIGLVEPMRVEEPYQRRGLARALLTHGIERLAESGARRLKVGFVSDGARALYTGVGFRVAGCATTYRLTRPAARPVR